MRPREQMKNEALLLWHWTSSVSLEKCASVSAAFILLLWKAALLRNRQCSQPCTCQPWLRSWQMLLGGFFYYFFIYISCFLNIYIKVCYSRWFWTSFLSYIFQVSTNNSFWCFLVLHYSSALSTCSTLAKLFTSLLSSSLKVKKIPFHLLHFWAVVVFGSGVWTTAELWVAFPAFGESHGVTSHLSYITFCPFSVNQSWLQGRLPALFLCSSD